MKEHPSYGERALCFWSWNAKLEEGEIRRQLAEFAAGRFGGVIIHARAGLETAYMGDEWFAAYEIAVKEAERLGLHVWIYDEDGWPSGFAGGAVPALGDEYCLKKLKAGYGPPAGGTLLAVYRRGTDGRRERAPLEPIREDDLVFWTEIDRHYVDLLSPETVAAFIAATHERYKERFSAYFGTTIQGVFTDEPQLNVEGYAWSDTLADQYAAAYGEELWPSLYLLKEEDEGYREFRCRYWRLISGLLYRSFTKPIADWCAANGLVMTGHFGSEDGLCGQVGSNGGVMAQYTAMHMPGIDHLGNRITSPVLMKQLSSAARQTGKPYTLSETFGCSGWGIPFSQLAWIWGRQAALGVTTPCFHLSPLSIQGRRKRDYPAFFSYHEPWWEAFPAFMRWMNTLNRLMGEGERLADVLVVSPLYSVMAEYDPYGDSRRDMQRYSAQFRLLLENLLDIQLDFDIGDERILEEAGAARGGQLQVGRAAYTTVVVSECLSLTGGTCRLLRDFAAQGGRVVFVGAKPARVDMRPSGEAAALSPDVLQNRRELLERWVSAAGISRFARVLNTDDLRTAKGIIVHTRRLDGGYRVHVWTDTAFSGRGAALFLQGGREVLRVDLQSGERTALPSHRLDGGTLVSLSMEPKANYVFDIREAGGGEVPAYRLLDKRPAAGVKVTLCHDNCLTIDKACLSIDGGAYTGETPVIHLLDRIYQYQRQVGRTFELRLRYTFTCGEGFHPDRLSLVLEDEPVSRVEVNGVALDGRIGWWLGRCMGEYAVAPLLAPGKNTVTLTYTMSRPASTVEVGGVYETERNRFFYPVEPDSVYLKGDFDLSAEGAVVNRYRCYQVKDAAFTLRAPTGKRMDDLTTQGCWFYRGDALYAFRVKKPPENRRLIVKPAPVFGACVVWRVGDRQGVLFEPPYELDITAYLLDGESEVFLQVVGTNRNLLGPHHHVQGENDMVGPNTFSGCYGFEDFVTPGLPDGESTWTDEYSFIPFGCGSILLYEYEQTVSRYPMNGTRAL